MESKSQPLKKMIPQLLISVSLFSFLLSYSSLYNSSSSPKSHHYAFNKNCLFLICNGLLVFLAKTSGFIQPPTGHDLNNRIADTLHATLDKYMLEAEESSDGGKIADETKEVSIFIAESEEEGGGEATAPNSPDVEKDETHQPDSKSCWLFGDDGEQLYGHEDEDEDEDKDEDEEDEDEDEVEEKKEEMSTEELNQKFEDFIRKMKEEIIISEGGHAQLTST